MPATTIYHRVNHNDRFDPRRKLVTSPIFSAKVLAFIRLLFAAYSLGTFFFTLFFEIFELKTGQKFLCFFTNLSYSGLCGYFSIAGYHTLKYAKHSEEAYPLQRWSKVFQWLHLMLLATITTFPIIVTVVFWGLLLPTQSFDTTYDLWADISVHALNAVFALFEILFTNTPPAEWKMLIPCIVIQGLYLGVAYITKATQGFYPYPFLDPAEEGPLVAAYIVGIAVAEIVVFAIVRFIVVGREKLAIKLKRVPTVPTVEVFGNDKFNTKSQGFMQWVEFNDSRSSFA
ncbi:hypothetical protein AX16_006633 [Volvariella volvacea WC 439]|nr:hypothetical protein AX16_006633 [Volvariella volvacea WC 439]